MAKVLATEIRIGHLLEWEKRIWRVIKCYHVHVGGRGGAFMQVEMKDIEVLKATHANYLDHRGTVVGYQIARNYAAMLDKAARKDDAVTFLQKEVCSRFPIGACVVG